eukprot:4027596-Amphidinium_carterae.1
MGSDSLAHGHFSSQPTSLWSSALSENLYTYNKHSSPVSEKENQLRKGLVPDDSCLHWCCPTSSPKKSAIKANVLA